MEESIVETKPAVSVEPLTQPIVSNTDNKLDSIDDNLSANNEKSDQNEDQSNDKEEDKVENDDKMEVDSSLIETDKDLPQISVESDDQKLTQIEDNSIAKTNEKEVSVGVEETNGVEESKDNVAAVEPMPEFAVKSPTEVQSVIDKITSPSPVPSATPPRSQSTKKPKVDLTSVPVRQYLDTTVVPILLQGLSSLAKERPAKPIAYLANFLLEKASEYDDE
jgi:protein dpy-30